MNRTYLDSRRQLNRVKELNSPLLLLHAHSGVGTVSILGVPKTNSDVTIRSGMTLKGAMKLVTKSCVSL